MDDISRLQRTRSALFFLKQARALLAPDYAPQTLARVRAAIKSAEGAVRHAEGLETRATLDYADLRNARDPEGDPLDGDNLEDAETPEPAPDSTAGLERARRVQALRAQRSEPVAASAQARLLERGSHCGDSDP